MSTTVATYRHMLRMLVVDHSGGFESFPGHECMERQVDSDVDGTRARLMEYHQSEMEISHVNSAIVWESVSSPKDEHIERKAIPGQAHSEEISTLISKNFDCRIFFIFFF